MDNSDGLREMFQPPWQLPDTLWRLAGAERNRRISPVYIARYAGPRKEVPLGEHAFWEISYVNKGSGFLDLETESLALETDSAVLLPPGTRHRERTKHPKWDVLWLAFTGTLPAECGLVAPLLLRDAHALAPWAENLWLWAQRQPGAIGPELDAACEFFVRALVRLTGADNQHERKHWLQAVLDHLDRHLDRGVYVEDMAAIAGLSVGHFHRQFRQATGETPVQYLTRRRLDLALLYLRQSGLSVKAVAAAVGFNDQLYFSRVFRHRFGFPPSAAGRG